MTTRRFGRVALAICAGLGLALLLLSGFVREPQQPTSHSPFYAAGIGVWTFALLVALPVWVVGVVIDRRHR